ncbi:hypothetical protein FOA43_002655 [Brettanomyces nanus]|uniref:inositol phosphorylceramide mannosyltransferase n=1 Tax=Eeniella nana TaxID=13502 RepID=A0A875S841_EENNA|nr:uncharacterized protein FOA43_002655 [Brettanomyces nanus]QPG75304.1 hypothetical protein FOA43_002655 [Brettanomyces nanus]
MRRSLKVIIWAHITIAAFLLYCSLDLLLLPLDDLTKDALLDSELNSADDKIEKPAIIPKIIHQTYKTEDVPEIWRAGQQRCKDLHPEYEYILWTDDMARKLIEEEYDWFLETWDSYKFPIERADAIRYFALVRYGGIYIDLDDGCERKLDPLLTVPAFARTTTPTGVSNDVLGSVPGHPFFVKVLNNLQNYNRNWLVPYITIMFSTGPLFLSVILEQYRRNNIPEEANVRIMLPDDYTGKENSFFVISKGSSWHLDDARFIKALGRHIPLAVFCGITTGCFIFLMEWYFYQWCIRTNFFRSLDHMSSKVGWKTLRTRPRKDSNLPVNTVINKEDDMV